MGDGDGDRNRCECCEWYCGESMPVLVLPVATVLLLSLLCDLERGPI